MTVFSASMEIGGDGWTTAWLVELPGLFVNESSERAARRTLPAAVTACAGCGGTASPFG